MQHADRIRAVASDPSASARSALFASWARSISRYKLDPLDSGPPRKLSERELCHSRAAVEPLLSDGATTLDRLFAAVGGSGCCVLFTDRHGVPVDRRGAGSDDDEFRNCGLWPGAVWSEESEGTNGIGTCLAESRPLTIHRDQHFYLRNTGLTCAVAPIYDHRGELAAALDVSTCRNDLTEDVVRLIGSAVLDAARKIEARHFIRAFPGARIVLVTDTECSAGALLAIGDDDLVIGATHAARHACGITDAMIERGIPAQLLLEPQQEDGEDLRRAERGVLQRALARCGGNVSVAARTLGISRATLHRKLHRAGLAKAVLREGLAAS